jgi:hypothetical protein
MTGYDTMLLVVSGGVASEFENLSSKIFEDGGEVNWGTGTDTLGVVALLEKTVNTTDWELEPSFCRARYGFAS